MRIQINSDQNVRVDTRLIQFVRGEVNRFLKRFGSKLTRVEVHLSDVNSRKFGINDKRCLIEVRPARHRPLTATNRAQTVRQAVGGALTKLRTGLETFYGRLEKRGERRFSRSIVPQASAWEIHPLAAASAFVLLRLTRRTPRSRSPMAHGDVRSGDAFASG